MRIYADHINKIHSFFAPRGIRMIVFDDMPRPKWFRYDGPHCPFDSDEQIARVLEEIPKDVAMHMWKYSWPVEEREMVEGTAWFAKRGFEVLLGPGHHAHGAQLLFDATANAITMLEYGLRSPGDAGAPKASGVIAYSPHIFPQEPYYHALAEKMKSGRDDGGRRFMQTALGDRAEPAAAALADITDCVLNAHMAADRVPLMRKSLRIFLGVNYLANQSPERRGEVRACATQMAKAADEALAALEGVAPSPAADRFVASFYLARTVASRLAMADALLEGKDKVFARLTERNLAEADRELAGIRGVLEDGLGHVDRALRALEPLVAWDRHVIRLLCLLTTEKLYVENQLQLLDLTQRNLDDVLHHRDALPWWPWPPQWYQE